MNELYYNLPNSSAFAGQKQLQLQSKKPLKDVKTWLSKQRVYTLHKQIKRRYPTRPYRAKFKNQFWETDLVDMQNYVNENDSFKYIITVIDVFSRYGFALALKNKSKLSIINAFKSIFENEQPKYLSSDEGKEFTNKLFTSFLNGLNIKQFFRKPPLKAALCERYNRTLKMKIEKYFTHMGNHRWVDILPDVVTSYNNAYHRTIKMSPSEAYNKKNRKKVFRMQEERIKAMNTYRKQKFKKGDYVRIAKYKPLFEKGYTPNWSEEVFIIVKIHSKYKPIMYSVKDYNNEVIDGKFYTEELQKIAKPEFFAVENVIESKGKRSLVKFFNYHKPEWVLTKSINKISDAFK